MIFEIKHPLIEDKLTRIRNKETPSYIFQENIIEITQLLAYEATKKLPLKQITIDTPIQKNTLCYKLENDITIVPILRAGVGMADGIKKIIPNSSVGFIGLYRDEDTLLPIEYYSKLPVNISNNHVFIVDPMLATGSSLVKAIDIVKKEKPLSITLICIVGCNVGVEYLKKHYPEIDLYIASIDKQLNDDGYIVPGLGDAGDRLFGTK